MKKNTKVIEGDSKGTIDGDKQNNSESKDNLQK